MKNRKGARRAAPYVTGAVIAAGVLLLRGFFSAADAQERLTILSDACFVSGILLVCAGTLMLISDGGLFDMIRFGALSVYWVLLKEERRAEKPRSFYAYRQHRLDKVKPRRTHLFISGTAFIALAFIFLFI